MRSELPAVLLATMLIALPAVIASLFGDTGYTALRYDNLAMAADAQWWRGITGHWVHLGPEHLALNLLMLAALALLAGPWLGAAGLMATAIIAAVVISSAFWLFHPDLLWYAGLSGVNAAVWAGGAVRGLRSGSWLAALLLLALFAKLAADLFTNAPVTTAQLIGGAVIVEAHLYGALTGAALAALLPRPR